MAYIEHTDDVGAGWRASFLDGTLDKQKVAEGLVKLHPETSDTSPAVENLAEIASVAHLEFHKQHKPQFDWYCDLFVLQPPEGEPEKMKDSCAVPWLLDESQSVGINYLLQIENGCPYYKECLESTASAVGLLSRPYHEYTDFELYRAKIRKLAEELLVPYIAPCMIVAEKIEQHGFQCCGQ